MRRTVRTSILASTAAIAAAVGAVALAPIASAQEEAPAPILGSAEMESADLVVSLGTTCVNKTADKPADGQVVALQVTVKNVGKGAASAVSVNYGAIPVPMGAVTEDKIEPATEFTATVPSGDVEWVSRPTGAVAFSPQLDANYPDNIKVEFLSRDCAPVVEDGEE
ncbi:MAG: Pro-kumamolisin, activation domain family protein [Rhodococcus sp. (in: high G+C Gram-positive bacteria)]